MDAIDRFIAYVLRRLPDHLVRERPDFVAAVRRLDDALDDAAFTDALDALRRQYGDVGAEPWPDLITRLLDLGVAVEGVRYNAAAARGGDGRAVLFPSPGPSERPRARRSNGR